MSLCINHEIAELYSFDIFDTLVTRRVATPRGIFAIMQNFLITNTNISDFIKNNFYRIRMESEHLARKNSAYFNHGLEINFDSIYNLIKHNYNLADDEINFLKNLEISTEINNIVPISCNIELLKKLLSENKRVILISDMYYSSEILRKILCNIDRIFADIKIYVSSEYGLSKGDSELYKKIKEEENIEYKDWMHYGDNIKADIKNAKKLGIKTFYYPQKQQMPYEKALLCNNFDNVYYQAIIGSAKLARLTNRNENEKYNFGASYAAPILYNYIEYCLNQSLYRGFKTLYFIARDGCILKLIADEIITRKHLNLKTKYIYGSRLAWRILTEENFEDLINITLNEFKNQLSVNLLAYRLGIDSKEFGELIGLSNLTRILDNNDQNLIVEKIKSSEAIKKRIIEVNKPKKEILLDYFRQEIDFSEKNIVFIDSNGTGRTQDVITPILNEISDCKVWGFYFTNPLMKQNEKSIKLCYGIIKPYYYSLELLCRAKEGQTIGYKKEGNSIFPVLEEEISDSLIKWGIDLYYDGVLAYVKNIIDFEIINKMQINNLDLYCKYYDYLVCNLDKKTAKILGDIPYSLVGEEKIKISSSRVSPVRLILMYINGQHLRNYTTFPFIALARSSCLTQFIYKFIEKHPNFKKFIFNFVFDQYKKCAYLEIFGLRISFSHYLRNQKNNEPRGSK